MKKSFMTRVLAVSLSAAMAFSLSSANLMTASAATAVSIAKTKTVTVGDTSKKLKLKNNTQGWKIFKATSNKKAVCKIINRKPQKVTLNPLKAGKATITVKIRRTNKKGVEVNKSLKCKVTVKAKATPNTPDDNQPGNQDPVADALRVDSISATSSTEIVVNFNKEVDGVTASNFQIPGLTVSNAVLSSDKKQVTLTVSEMEAGKSYSVTVTGVQANGKVESDVIASVPGPEQEVKYIGELTTDAPNKVLRGDLSQTATVTFEVKDRNGNSVPELENMAIAFDASHGTIDSEAVIQQGKATVQYTSAFYKENPTYAVITARVKESAAASTIGATDIRDTLTIRLAMTAEEASNNTGARLVGAEAETADRIVAFFDTEVNEADYMNATTGRLNSDVNIQVWSGLNNQFDETASVKDGPMQAVGVRKITGNPKALEVLLPSPLRDNSNVKIRCTGSKLTGEQNFKLTDARQPSVYRAQNVDASGKTTLRDITVDFSEAVYTGNESGGIFTSPVPSSLNNGNGVSQYQADRLENYMLDGRPLSYYNYDENGVAKTASMFDVPSRNDATKNRSQVTIKLGCYKNGDPVYLSKGLHYLQVRNVGDWAAKTDGEVNAIATQTVYFTVEANDAAPTLPEVEVQSPEQLVLDFGVPVSTRKGVAMENVVEFQYYDRDASTPEWKSVTTKKQKYNLIPADSSNEKWILEVETDWSRIWQTRKTDKNYNYYQYRIRIAADKIYNAANNKNNALIEVPVELKLDKTSPKVVDITREPGASYAVVTLSEPMQIKYVNGTDLNSPAGEGRDAKRWRTTPDESNSDVPEPIVTFHNLTTGESVEGIVTRIHDVYDKQIRVVPRRVGDVNKLKAGTWTVYVSAITDDVGNAIETDNRQHTFELTAETTNTQFQIEWALVSNSPYLKGAPDGVNYNGVSNVNDGRYIFIKFSRPVDTRTANLLESALVQSVYTVNAGAPGIGANVMLGIQGYSTESRDMIDCITVDMGKAYMNRQSTMLTVSAILKSATGQTLSTANNGNTNEYALPFGIKVNATGLTEESATSASQLKELLKNKANRKIKLTGLSNQTINVGDLTIDHAVELDLNGAKIAGNVTIAYEDSDMFEITNSDTTYVGTIENLTINTPNADVFVGGKVKLDTNGNPEIDTTGSTINVAVEDLTVEAIPGSTMYLGRATVDKIQVEDNDGAGISLDALTTVTNLVINGGGTISLSNDGTNNIGTIEIKQAATFELEKGTLGASTTIVVTSENVTLAQKGNADLTAVKIEVDNGKAGVEIIDKDGSSINDKVTTPVAVGKQAVDVELDKLETSVTVSGNATSIKILKGTTDRLSTAKVKSITIVGNGVTLVQGTVDNVIAGSANEVEITQALTADAKIVVTVVGTDGTTDKKEITLKKS